MTLIRIRSKEHQLPAVSRSAPIVMAVLRISCPNAQISPPVRNAFIMLRGRLCVGVMLFTYFT